MYSREWRGVQLTKLPAARENSDKLPGPELYKQFYEALETLRPESDRAWRERKTALGKAISRQILDGWEQRHRRPPRILALAVGQGFSEGTWLEEARDVTLHECQEVSLRELRTRFPSAPTVFGEAGELQIPGKYDVISMLALDYALGREGLSGLFYRTRSWLLPDGLLLVYSVSILSFRQWAAEIVKTASKRYERGAYVLWGWWRTPGAIQRMASQAGLRLDSVYGVSGRPDGAGLLVKRSRALRALPPLRQNALLLVFGAG